MKQALAMVAFMIITAVSLIIAEETYPGKHPMVHDSTGLMTDANCGMDHPCCKSNVSWQKGKNPCREKCGVNECTGNLRSSCMTGMMRHPFSHSGIPPFLFLIIVLSIFVMVNILLTIIVVLDMTNLRRFNGLWIPIVLIMGIPGTALYALFRIGDTVRLHEVKPT